MTERVKKSAQGFEEGGFLRAGKSLALVLVAVIVGMLIGSTLDRKSPEHGSSGPQASSGKQLWTCGMHPQVIQDKPGTCPICGMALEPMRDDPSSGKGTKASGQRKIKYWWDPMMNPPYISEKPGKSPMGMDLVPVYEDEISGGAAVQIDPVVVQNMGVRLARPIRGPVERKIRAVGFLSWAEPNVHDINLRVSGWVEKLFANTEGMRLDKDQALFELYSPELQVAVEELISARRASGAAVKDDRSVSKTLYETARRKLQQWGVSGGEIDRLSNLDAAPPTVTFMSPISGELIEKNLVEGASAMTGQRALRIVNRNVLWLDAQVYPMDLPFIKKGQSVQATIEGLPGTRFQGEISFIDPRIDPVTRTAKVRVVLPNKDLSLRPGMFAMVEITAQIAGSALLVPREAIIDTGTRQVVFVALGGGHFEPRNVELGPSSDGGLVQILSGISPAETVVISGQFLLDSESRMKEAIQKHLSDRLARDGTDKRVEAPQRSERKLASPPFQAAVNGAVKEYLKLSEALGRVQESDLPEDVTGLKKQVEALRSAAGEPQQEELIQSMAAAVERLGNGTKDAQREAFKAVSAGFIRLIEQWPPTSDASGPDGKILVYYCPMAGASWLQGRNEKAANPYYARSMKACAELRQSIEAAPALDGAR